MPYHQPKLSYPETSPQRGEDAPVPPVAERMGETSPQRGEDVILKIRHRIRSETSPQRGEDGR